MSVPSVYLVDASPYIFRAFFSLPSSMVDSAGRPVGAVYGFASFLIRLIGEEQPSHLGVAFDGSLTSSFRNEIYPPYKAHRELPPVELEEQLTACREVAEAMGAATFIDLRYEADDLIGTLAQRVSGESVTVVSSDKDLAQLVGRRVTLLDFARGVRYTPEAVLGKFGVRPEQIVDLLALAGDSVDNIPGVRGVGHKTAVALLSELGSLEGIYARLEEVERLPIRGARAVRQRLETGREDAFLSWRLASIALDAPVRADLDSLRLSGADPEILDPLFERLGFGGLRRRIPLWKAAVG